VYAGTGTGVWKFLTTSSPVITVPDGATCTVNAACSIVPSIVGWPAPTTAVSGSIPPGLGLDRATGILSGTPSLAGVYLLTLTATNGIPPDATRAVTLNVQPPPADALAVTISAPTGIAALQTLATISGTASGTELLKVEVAVTDGVYFLQGDGSFGVGENWLAASGTTSWSLDTSSVTWVAGVTYTVRVKVFSSGASYLVTTTFKMAQSPQKVATILVGSFTTTTPYIRVGDSVSITGSLRRGDANVPVVNQNVVVVVTSPAGVSSPLTPTPYVLQSDGTSGTFSTPPITFTQPGLYTFRIRFDGGGSYRASSTVLHLPVLPRSGYAIIVTGKATDQSLLALHTATTNAIYATLVQKRGFLPGDILQLTSTASTPVTKQQLQGAIIGWARDKLATAAAPLYLFMVDHGSQAGFVLNTETLSPDDLQGYLDALESDPAVAAAVAAYRRFVVIGTCYSGVFVDRISKPGRVVVTSTTGLEQSIAGISIYNSATAATLNGGEYFIDNLINFLGRGDSFRDAFATSRDMVALRDPRQVAPGAHADAYDTLAQHPLLDDLGDRKGSYLLDGTPQGSFSSGQQLGVGIRVPGNPADITAVTETSILSTQDAGSLPLWLTVNDSSHMARAWVEIRTPVTSVSSNGGTGQVIPHLITMPLYYDGARWQGGYSFPEPGSYDILYYSQDNQTGDVSPMVHGRVYRQLSGDTAPQSFTLTYPKDQATVAQQFTLFWNPALSANKVSYTLLVMKQDGTTVYKKEGIPQPGSYLTADDLKDPASNVGGYYCQNGASYCSWKVQAIDSYGAITESATGSFTILPASEPALVLGTVTDATTGVPLAGATIGDVNGARAITLANGYFVFAADAGNNYTLSADAGGSYLPASSSVTTAPGTVTTVNFSLSPAPVNGTCGTGSGEAYSSAPTSNLCASGTLSAAPSGGGPWNWSCYGSYGGASAYCTALMTQSITVTTAAPGSAEYHSQFSVAATAPGGTVSCSSGSPTVCTNSGGTFTMIAASGTCLVRYDQGGSASYEPAARVTGSVSAVKGSQAIGLVTFNPATLSTGGTATVGASSSSGQGVIFTSTTPSVCTVSGSTVTALGAGTCTIAADQGGDANYDAATQVIQSLDVGVGVQAITGFTPPGTKNFGDAPISLAATGGGSGNPVTFSVASGPGNLSGTNNATLTITGAGTIMVKASQGGSANYAAAPDVSQTITVTKAVLTVTADNQSRAANSANSPLTASYSGFVNADTASVLSGAPGISTSATFSSPAGSYPIIVAQGSLTSSNYSFGFVNGTLTVTQEFPATHAVTGSNSGSGGIRCESPVNDGSTSSCTLTPAVGYRVSSVSGCGSGTWNGSNYTTGAITGDCTVSATFAPVKPGDCDADGVVTIAEVQSAINMSLGMKAVAACVDTDGNGTVGIAEVQKVIDAFLGL